MTENNRKYSFCVQPSLDCSAVCVSNLCVCSLSIWCQAYLITCVWNCYRYVTSRGSSEVLLYVTTNDTTVSHKSIDGRCNISPASPHTCAGNHPVAGANPDIFLAFIWEHFFLSGQQWECFPFVETSCYKRPCSNCLHAASIKQTCLVCSFQLNKYFVSISSSGIDSKWFTSRRIIIKSGKKMRKVNVLSPSGLLTAPVWT